MAAYALAAHIVRFSFVVRFGRTLKGPRSDEL